MSDTTHNPAERSMTMSGKPSGFRSLLGYRAVRWERNCAEIELLLGPQHMNSLGIVHGGLYMTILDAALGHAVTWCSVPGNVRGCVTVSLNTTFLAPVATGIIRSIGTLEAIHDRIAVATAVVLDEHGKLCATAQGSFRYFAGSEREEGVPKLRTISG